MQANCPAANVSESITLGELPFAGVAGRPYPLVSAACAAACVVCVTRHVVCVRAAELGHLKCDHGLWLTVANVLAMGTVSLLPIISGKPYPGSRTV